MKYSPLILGSVICLVVARTGGAAPQDIFRELIESNQSLIVREPNSKGYLVTLVFGDSSMSLLYEGMGFEPSLLAYKISEESIDLVIKTRWSGDEEPLGNRQIPSSAYFSVTIAMENKMPRVRVNKIGELNSVVLDGFTHCVGVANEKSADLRVDPLLSSEAKGKLQFGDQRAIIRFDSTPVRIGALEDYWYLVQTEMGQFWVFGYYVDFKKTVTK